MKARMNQGMALRELAQRVGPRESAEESHPVAHAKRYRQTTQMR
jgi:hypothetical protein